MAWSQEAIIALVGVLINLPTFGMVLWRMCRRRNNTDNSTGSLEEGGSEAHIQAPWRFTTEHALALPYAVPLISVAQHLNRQ